MSAVIRRDANKSDSRFRFREKSMRSAIFTTVVAAILGVGVISAGQAVESQASPNPAAAHLSKKKQTKLALYVTAKEAYELYSHDNGKVLFVDVRTRAEVNFLGMPTLADANIPYMEMNEWYAWDEKKNEFKMEVNSNFAEAISGRLAQKGLTKSDQIVLMCRSGSRSAKAADLLADLGYTQVYTIIDGYEGDTAKDGPSKGQRTVNGWRNASLPWTYKLDKNKMYLSKN